MTSVLRNLQAEWNELVPLAQAQGIRRVRLLNAPLETIAYRAGKLAWLRSQLRTTLQASTSISTVDTLGINTLTFGVELEFIIPRGQDYHSIAAKISAAGVVCSFTGYDHNNGANWKVVTDASVPGGCEVVSPVLKGEEGFRQLRTVCNALTALRCKINTRCGFHVHVGASTESVSFFKNLIKLYSAAEIGIDSFMANSRRASNGNYCRSLRDRVRPINLNRADTLDTVAAAIGQQSGRAYARSAGRYSKLNLQSFWQHGTVEFRHHQGTVEAVKAENWVKLCLRMCLAARTNEVTSSVMDLNALFTLVGATPSEVAYFQGRVNYFNRGNATATVAQQFETIAQINARGTP